MPFVKAHEKQLEYFETGNGSDTVVLIHGAGSSALIWHEVQSGLAEAGFHTIAISLCGAGGSDRTGNLSDYTPASYARDIRCTLDSLGIDRCAIAGHSLGVSNVLNLASDFAGGLTIRALILMAGGNVVGREAQTPEQEAKIRAAMQPPDPSRESERRAAWEKVHPGLPRDIRDGLWRDIQHNPPERMLGQRLGARKDMTGFANQCEIPTLIISGDRDSVVPLAMTLQMYPRFRDDIRHMHIMHGVDHYPNAEVPEEVARVCGEFLKQHQR